MITTFPVSTRIDNVTLRPMTEADMPAIAGLFVKHDLEFIGRTNYSEEMLRSDWFTLPNFSLEDNVRIAHLSDGTITGFMVCYDFHPVPVHPHLWGYVLPGHRDGATYDLLIEWGMERAKQVFSRVPEHARVVVGAGVISNDQVTAQRLTRHGLERVRCNYTMRIDFDGEPETPQLPEGIRLVTFDEMPDVKLWANTHKVSFADHRGSTENTPLDFYIGRLERELKEPTFDPKLWWLALDGDTQAGLSLTWPTSDEDPDMAWVSTLGVMPEYRRRGLGRAMLLHSFIEYYRRGKKAVGLGVDGASLTGAVRLYERAGMRVFIQWDVYERELRAGIEISKQ